MRTVSRPRRPWLCACVLAAAAHCGAPSRPQPTITAAGPDPLLAAASPRAPAVDLSEVARPAGVVAVVRVSPLTPLLERVGRLTGAGEMIRPIVEEAVRQLPGDEALGALADYNAPIDAMWLARPGGGPRGQIAASFVLSFGAPSIEQIESRLSNTHRLVLTLAGVYRVERVSAESGARVRGYGEEQEGFLGLGAMQCVVAQTPRPTASRVVCSDDEGALPLAVPYAARTLTRRDVPLNTVTFEAVPEALRLAYGQSVLADIDRERAQINRPSRFSPGGPWADQTSRTAMLQLMSEVLDNFRSVITDTSGLSGTISFAEDRVTLHGAYDTRNPSGTLIRAAAEAMRGQPAPPAEHLAHTPANALVYAAGGVDLRPFRAQVAQLVTVCNALAQSNGALLEPDRAAIRQALDAITVLDQAAFAGGMGYDDRGEIWGAARSRLTARPAAEVVAAFRTVVTMLNRPAVARHLDRFWTFGPPPLDPRRARVVTVAGLPQGAFAFSMPSLAESVSTMIDGPGYTPPPPPVSAPAVRGRGRPLRARPTPQPVAPRRPVTQFVLVANGQDLTVLFGADARAALARDQATAPPGIDPQALQPQGASVVFALVPAAIPNILRSGDPGVATQIAAVVSHMQDGGRTPISLRLGTQQVDGATRFTADLEVRAQTLGIVGMVAQFFSAP